MVEVYTRASAGRGRAVAGVGTTLSLRFPGRSAISPCQARSTSSGVPRGFEVDGRGVVRVGVEGRVQIDQIDAHGVHVAYDVEIVAGPHGAGAPS